MRPVFPALNISEKSAGTHPEKRRNKNCNQNQQQHGKGIRWFL
jgi:hypothetical protein